MAGCEVITISDSSTSSEEDSSTSSSEQSFKGNYEDDIEQIIVSDSEEEEKSIQDVAEESLIRPQDEMLDENVSEEEVIFLDDLDKDSDDEFEDIDDLRRNAFRAQQMEADADPLDTNTSEPSSKAIKNIKERERRFLINNMYTKLRNLLPNGSALDKSKSKVLQEVIVFVNQLRQGDAKLDLMEEMLLQENYRLKEKQKRLSKLREKLMLRKLNKDLMQTGSDSALPVVSQVVMDYVSQQEADKDRSTPDSLDQLTLHLSDIDEESSQSLDVI